MNSFTASAPKGFAVRNAYVSNCPDEQLIAEYSDFVHTLRWASASSDERHAILAEIRRRGLVARYVETPQAIEERYSRKAMDALFLHNAAVLPLPWDLAGSWLSRSHEKVKTFFAKVFRGNKQ